MINKNHFIIFTFLIPVLFMEGCIIDYTNYYSDPQNSNVAIFSNTGNDVMSCMVDGSSWRTIDRVSVPFNPTTMEISISKQYKNSINDYLVISWVGYYPPNSKPYGNIILNLVVPKKFGYKDFNALQGQRFYLDSTNGFFSLNLNYLNFLNGKGNIYFLKAHADSSGYCNISGIFDANFITSKITNGRFDHTDVLKNF